jgi:hypothetical protein
LTLPKKSNFPEAMIAEQAVLLRKPAFDAYEPDAFRPNLTQADASQRIDALPAKSKLISEPLHIRDGIREMPSGRQRNPSVQPGVSLAGPKSRGGTRDTFSPRCDRGRAHCRRKRAKREPVGSRELLQLTPVQRCTNY